MGINIKGEIPAEVLETILSRIKTISFGEIVLIAQDSVLVQVEFVERLRVVRSARESRETAPLLEQSLTAVSDYIRKEFFRLCYGRLTVFIKGGKVVQIERAEKQRFLGLNGEGI